MSIGSRIEKRGWVDAHSRPLSAWFGARGWSRWNIALRALAVFTVAMALAAIVTGEPMLLVIAASAWLLALSVYLWTTAES
ncbi:MAG: hypothetical protein ACRDKH_04375 [Solirubrobacterales bacterium]